MASFFCDTYGVILIDYLEKGRAITDNYYYLFPNLKRWLCGRRFKSNGEVE